MIGYSTDCHSDLFQCCCWLRPFQQRSDVFWLTVCSSIVRGLITQYTTVGGLITQYTTARDGPRIAHLGQPLLSSKLLMRVLDDNSARDIISCVHSSKNRCHGKPSIYIVSFQRIYIRALLEMEYYWCMCLFVFGARATCVTLCNV